MEFRHVSVLKDEAIDSLKIKSGGIYVDMTLGGGGHSAEIIGRGGRVIGIDRDINAINAARERLSASGGEFWLVNGNFKDVLEHLKGLNVSGVDGIIMDLGVSSHQLDESRRGFSYMNDAPLDMRMDVESDFSAFDVINTYGEDKLCRIIGDYGEERWAKRIAEFIVKRREEGPIRTTGELVDVIKAAVPKGARKDGPHPAKRTFQAIRIEVNGELEILKQAVTDAVKALNTGGRIAVITFHSLEDRIVKNTFSELAKGCVCPPEFPVCMCGKKPELQIITRKPVTPSDREIEENPRSRSAKLRVAEKIS